MVMKMGQCWSLSIYKVNYEFHIRFVSKPENQSDRNILKKISGKNKLFYVKGGDPCMEKFLF